MNFEFMEVQNSRILGVSVMTMVNMVVWLHFGIDFLLAR